LERVGRSAGNLYAVSTLASVAAALLTGFWLIPMIGVQRLTFATGLMLLIGAMIAWLADAPARARPVVGLLILLSAAAGLVAFWKPPNDARGNTLALVDSPYAEIRVVDHRDLRYLLIDGGAHTIVEPRTNATHHPYVPVAELATELFKHPGRVLMVGLGGG